MGKDNVSVAGKVFNVGKVRVHGSPNISYRQTLAASLKTTQRYVCTD